jgi:hypothetical protein
MRKLEIPFVPRPTIYLAAVLEMSDSPTPVVGGHSRITYSVPDDPMCQESSVFPNTPQQIYFSTPHHDALQ